MSIPEYLFRPKAIMSVKVVCVGVEGYWRLKFHIHVYIGI